MYIIYKRKGKRILTFYSSFEECSDKYKNLDGRKYSFKLVGVDKYSVSLFKEIYSQSMKSIVYSNNSFFMKQDK